LPREDEAAAEAAAAEAVVIPAEGEDQEAIMAEDEEEEEGEIMKVQAEMNQWRQVQIMISMMIHSETMMVEI